MWLHKRVAQGFEGRGYSKPKTIVPFVTGKNDTHKDVRNAFYPVAFNEKYSTNLNILLVTKGIWHSCNTFFNGLHN